MVNGLRFFFIVVSAFLMERVWGQTPSAQLVFIYCDYLHSKTPVIEDEEHSWQSLVRHFEAREGFTKGLEPSLTQEFQACVEKNRDLFESGEFILEGKSLLQSAREQLKVEAAPELFNAHFSNEERELSTPEYSLRLDEDVERGTNIRDAEGDLNRRDTAYQTMWTDFLTGLRKKITLLPKTEFKVSLQ